MARKLFYFLGMLACLSGCSDSGIEFGNWKFKSEQHQFAMLSASEARKINESAPAPFPIDNKMNWKRVKEIGEIPEKLRSPLEPYSVEVIDHGFAFLEVTRGSTKGNAFDDVEWGWKLTLLNKSARDVYAYGGYALFDKDGFQLVKVGKEWDNNEDGVLIKPGSRETIKGSGRWLVNRDSKPYPPARTAAGDYRLFLRHSEFEEFSDETKKGAGRQ